MMNLRYEVRDYAGFDDHGELGRIVSRSRVFIWMEVDFDCWDFFTSSRKFCCYSVLNDRSPVR